MVDESPSGAVSARASRGRSARSRWSHRLGTLLVVAGAGVLVWAFVVWQWNDPLTSLYTRYEQHRLEKRYEQVLAQTPEPASTAPAAQPPDRAAASRAAAAAAAQLRRDVVDGQPVGRIVVPQLGLSMLMVDGTSTAALRKGPGIDPRTHLPGQGELVDVAGHRTTYLAPFDRIDALAPGDLVTLEMPYGRFEYRVTGHRIVDAHDLSVLESKGREVVELHACHPRFFATQRYIVYASLVRFSTPDGESFGARQKAS